MFGDVGWGEILVIVLIGLFIFGPERLPKAAADLAKQLRALRRMASDATKDLRGEFGPEFDELRGLRDLHPRRFVGSLLTDDDEPTVPAPRTALAAGERPPYDSDAT